jgi:DNA invertase Pin-like site-specific DNA recombinase
MYDHPEIFTDEGEIKPMKIPTQKQLLSLQKKFKTDNAIGMQYGVTGSTVLRWRKKYGIKSLREFRETRNYQIKKLFKAGLSAVELAVKFKLSTSTVQRVTRGYKHIQPCD